MARDGLDDRIRCPSFRKVSHCLMPQIVKAQADLRRGGDPVVPPAKSIHCTARDFGLLSRQTRHAGGGEGTEQVKVIFESSLRADEKAMIKEAVREFPDEHGPLEVAEPVGASRADLLFIIPNGSVPDGGLKGKIRMGTPEEVILYVREIVAAMLDPSRCL